MRARRTIAELQGDAASHLARYCASESGYAWPAYDVDANRRELSPVDVLAPALLSYPIRSTYLEQMFRFDGGGKPANNYAITYDLMRAAVADERAHETAFERLPLERLDDRELPGWGLVLRALDAVQRCPGLTSVAVSKVLHRKLPQLVPINDTRLRRFYAVDGKGYVALATAIHADIDANKGFLTDVASSCALPDGTAMSLLRALDIVVWMSFEAPPTTGAG